jgi:predicted esterase
MRTDANLKTPLFMAHGEDDGVVNYKFGEMSYEALKKVGVNVEFHKIEDMAHEAQPDELNLLGAWLKERLAVPDSAGDETTTRGSGDETGIRGKV